MMTISMSIPMMLYVDTASLIFHVQKQKQKTILQNNQGRDFDGDDDDYEEFVDDLPDDVTIINWLYVRYFKRINRSKETAKWAKTMKLVYLSICQFVSFRNNNNKRSLFFSRTTTHIEQQKQR